MPVISIVHKDDVLNEAIKTKYYFDIRSILYDMGQEEVIGPNGNLYADNLKYRAKGRDCYDTVVYAYYHDSNAKKIRPLNVFDHGGFRRDVEKLLKKKDIDRDAFSKELRSTMMYYFWSKCEYEVIIKEWVGVPAQLHVDIFQQVEMNWNHFVDYLWGLRK